MREVVVFVHGIWACGSELALLRRRVSAAGYQVRQFRYPSLRASPAQNAVRLNAFLQSIDADLIHLVAHSLGGIVLCHLFNDFPAQRPGRVLMLGTPLRGSVVARQLASWPVTRFLLGHAIEQGLLGDGPRWPDARPLGMIAGTHGVLGVGLLVMGRVPRPHDGTVAVIETESSLVTEHLQVPYGHFSMLFARPIADVVCGFLAQGRLAP